MENIVLLELKRAHNENTALEIDDHKNGAEVDFLLREKLGNKTARQIVSKLTSIFPIIPMSLENQFINS